MLNPDWPIYTISSKRLFDLCPKKWEYRRVKELDLIEMPATLARGVTFHEDAEAIHTGEEAESPGGKGYGIWVKALEEFQALQTEIPIIIPISILEDWYAGCDPKLGSSGTLSAYFGGVIDMVALHAGENWLVDHKSTSRFYNYPRLYATEQLGMYALAWELSGNQPIAGVCISRVKIKENITYPHFQNYLLKDLKTRGVEVPVATLKGMAQHGRRIALHSAYAQKDAQRDAQKDTQKDALHKESTKESTIIILPLQEKKLLQGLDIRDNQGRLIESIRYIQGMIVHIRRHFYDLSEQEKRNILGDFLQYVYTARDENFRRSPGLHCAQCPYAVICEQSRKGEPETPIEKLGLHKIAPNQEITRVLSKMNKIATEGP